MVTQAEINKVKTTERRLKRAIGLLSYHLTAAKIANIPFIRDIERNLRYAINGWEEKLQEHLGVAPPVEQQVVPPPEWTTNQILTNTWHRIQRSIILLKCYLGQLELTNEFFFGHLFQLLTPFMSTAENSHESWENATSFGLAVAIPNDRWKCSFQGCNQNWKRGGGNLPKLMQSVEAHQSREHEAISNSAIVATVMNNQQQQLVVGVEHDDQNQLDVDEGGNSPQWSVGSLHTPP